MDTPDAETYMDDQILSGAVFVALNAIFGAHGMGALVTAYRNE
jgi:hypothetical protein